MRWVSALLRLLSGLAIMVLAVRVQWQDGTQLRQAGAGTIRIVGHEVHVTATQAEAIIIGIFALGLVLSVIAVVTLVRLRQR